MKFFDHAYITIESGKGGDGCSSARREAGVPYGGPNGGNGGRGGHVYIMIDPQINTLLPFKFQRNYKAPAGERGQSRDKYGKNAQDLIINVPLGTLIKDQDTGKVLYVADQVSDTPFLLLKGGDGGAGNMHFKNSILQYPEFCLMGEPGQHLNLELELQLLADVGLVGTPSVGKSSIINTVSNAKAQVAEYHFTTITPNLGSVHCEGTDWNVIDIPGIIEGASSGKGLGIEFLRHIIKCSIFNFVVDLSRRDDAIQEFITLWGEITTYCTQRFAQDYMVEEHNITTHILVQESDLILQVKFGDILITQKALMWTINKSDTTDDQEVRHEFVQQLIEAIQTSFAPYTQVATSQLTPVITHNILWTSTYTREGMTQLVYHWKQLIDKYNNTKFINRESATKIDEHTPNHVILLETKNVEDIDGYLEAKPYLLNQDDDMLLGEDEEFDEYEEYNEEFDEEKHKSVQNDLYEYHEEDSAFDEYDEEFNDEISPEERLTINIRLVYEPEIARIVYMVQWGNDQAEQRFWKYMQKSGAITWLRKQGVQQGDILTFAHPYYGVDERQIIFEI